MLGESNLGRLMVAEGLISETDCQTILQNGGHVGRYFVKAIIALGLLDEEEVVSFIAARTTHQIAAKNLIKESHPQAVSAVDSYLLGRLEVVPLHLDDNVLTVAMINPLDRETIRSLEFFTGLVIRPLVATVSQIEIALKRLLPGFRNPVSPLEEFIHNHADSAARRLRAGIQKTMKESQSSRQPESKATSKTKPQDKPSARETEKPNEPFEVSLSVPEAQSDFDGFLKKPSPPSASPASANQPSNPGADLNKTLESLNLEDEPPDPSKELSDLDLTLDQDEPPQIEKATNAALDPEPKADIETKETPLIVTETPAEPASDAEDPFSGLDELGEPVPENSEDLESLESIEETNLLDSSDVTAEISQPMNSEMGSPPESIKSEAKFELEKSTFDPQIAVLNRGLFRIGLATNATDATAEAAAILQKVFAAGLLYCQKTLILWNETGPLPLNDTSPVGPSANVVTSFTSATYLKWLPLPADALVGEPSIAFPGTPQMIGIPTGQDILICIFGAADKSEALLETTRQLCQKVADHFK